MKEGGCDGEEHMIWKEWVGLHGRVRMHNIEGWVYGIKALVIVALSATTLTRKNCGGSAYTQ